MRLVSAVRLVSSGDRCACSVWLGCEPISPHRIQKCPSFIVSYDDRVGAKAEHGRMASTEEELMIGLHELRPGLRVRGLVSAGEVTIVAIESHGDGIVNVVFRGDDGNIAECLLSAERAASVSAASADLFAPVAFSTVQPLPRHIGAADGRPSAFPAGLVTFLLTDIEGSTGLFRRLGERWPPLLDLHLDVLRAAVARYGGVDFKSEGDALLVAFGSAASAFEAAVDAQAQLRAVAWPVDAVVRVRMGLHSGVAHPRDGDYIALALHQAARVVGAGHGGQVLASLDAVQAAGEVPGVRSVRLGAYRLRDFDGAVELFQVMATDLIDSAFPSLRAVAAEGHNLERPADSFIGRDGDLEELERLIAPRRLVSVCGPGGMGKTRLVTEFGLRAAERWADGVWMVELASIAAGQEVGAAVAGALGVTIADDDANGAIARTSPNAPDARDPGQLRACPRHRPAAGTPRAVVLSGCRRTRDHP